MKLKEKSRACQQASEAKTTTSFFRNICRQAGNFNWANTSLLHNRLKILKMFCKHYWYVRLYYYIVKYKSLKLRASLHYFWNSRPLCAAHSRCLICCYESRSLRLSPIVRKFLEFFWGGKSGQEIHQAFLRIIRLFNDKGPYSVKKDQIKRKKMFFFWEGRIFLNRRMNNITNPGLLF